MRKFFLFPFCVLYIQTKCKITEKFPYSEIFTSGLVIFLTPQKSFFSPFLCAPSKMRFSLSFFRSKQFMGFTLVTKLWHEKLQIFKLHPTSKTPFHPTYIEFVNNNSEKNYKFFSRYLNCVSC